MTTNLHQSYSIQMTPTNWHLATYIYGIITHPYYTSYVCINFLKLQLRRSNFYSCSLNVHFPSLAIKYLLSNLYNCPPKILCFPSMAVITHLMLNNILHYKYLLNLSRIKYLNFKIESQS